jgi:hypothetical protein
MGKKNENMLVEPLYKLDIPTENGLLSVEPDIYDILEGGLSSVGVHG